ncbi:MAG TPA: S24/S26 family peptidase, partial [Aggregicoccus sp.]|nr:S24/S26 family peptidase [Aggregicoccus sp.]
PNLHTGDLTIVRRAAEYATGDVVAYLHPDVGTIIHRIVDREGEQFVLKGDHNTWLDSHRPEPSEVIGRLWLHLPSVGTFLQGMRAPWMLAVFGGLIGVMAVGGGAGKQAASALRRRQAAAPRAQSNRAISTGPGAQREHGWLALALGAVLASGVLAVLAYRTPLERSVLRDVTYEHSGTFTYAAPAAQGSRAYDGGGATTGDPIFRRVASTVNVEFDYQLLLQGPDEEAEVGGQYRIAAVVSDTNGWKRTLELAPLAPFNGTSFKAAAALDLPQLQALLDVVHEQTGVAREVYQVAVVPEIQLEGTLAGQVIAPAGGRFAPALTFKMDPFQLQPVTPPGFEGDPLKPAQRGLVKAPRVEPNGLPLLSLTLPLALARTLSLGAVALALLATGVVGGLVWRAGGRDEAERIGAQYGALVAAVKDGEAAARVGLHGAGGRTCVDLATFEDLARIAEREGRTILQHADLDGDVYLLPAGELTYRYVVASGAGAADPGTGGAILRLVPRSSPEPVALAVEPRFGPVLLERAG